MTENTDRTEMIREKVLAAIIAGQEHTFTILDQLHAKGIHDDEVVAALRALHEEELLDHYADWADLDLRDPEQRIPDGVVPDPGTNPSDLQMQQALDGKP